MAKLSENQEGALAALRTACANVEYVSKAVWKKSAPAGISIKTPAMLKTGTIVMIQAGVSTNGKTMELYKPA